MLLLLGSPVQHGTGASSRETIMHPIQERSAEEWFAEARRWYVEKHQGCPHCHTRHCVIRSQWAARIEYHCTECDFSTGQDGDTGSASANKGEPPPLRRIRRLRPSEARRK